MRAVLLERHGGPEVLTLTTVPDPAPPPGWVAVRVRACALNHLDLWARRGLPGVRFPLPLILGNDVAGVVREVGAGVDWVKPGDEVVLAPGFGCGHCAACLAGDDNLCRRYAILGSAVNGGYAERVVAPAANCLPRPARLSWPEAASLPLVFLTAWHMLAARAELAPHEDVLLHAAGSGVTTAGIQIARLLGARRILVTSSSAEKLDRARALGATHLIDVTTTDFARAAREATGGRGVDVVFDHLGGETFERSLKCLAWGGRLVTCGATAGASAGLPLRAVFFKSLSILGSTMGSNAELARLLPWFETGALRPVVARTFPLEEAPAAQELLAARGVFGKIVLTVGGGGAEVPRPKGD